MKNGKATSNADTSLMAKMEVSPSQSDEEWPLEDFDDAVPLSAEEERPSKRQPDDYGHMRYGKRDFDDYGHMRFGR